MRWTGWLGEKQTAAVWSLLIPWGGTPSTADPRPPPGQQRARSCGFHPRVLAAGPGTPPGESVPRQLLYWLTCNPRVSQGLGRARRAGSFPHTSANAFLCALTVAVRERKSLP